MTVAVIPASASAQRTGDNATTQAPDAFGTTIGTETIGLYERTLVRGFNPIAAGNVRIEGMYFDQVAPLSDRLIRSSHIKVGLSSLDFEQPAPSGIIDQLLRIPKQSLLTVTAGLNDYLAPFAAADGGLVTADGRYSLGIGLRADLPERYETGASRKRFDASALVRLAPRDKMSLTVFAAKTWNNDEFGRIALYPDGDFLPPRVRRRFSYDQPWAQGHSSGTNLGAIASVGVGEGWTIQAAGFWSLLRPGPQFNEQYVRLGLNGIGFNQVVARNPETSRKSLSGELRLSKVIRDGDRLHRFSAGVRGRASDQHYGGDYIVKIGERPIGVRNPVPKPDLFFSAQTDDQARQLAGTLFYRLDWAKVGLLNLGIQKVRFTKSVDAPSGSGTISSTGSSSPVLFNAGGALQVSKSLALFMGYTRGLEEGGTAPPSASNREAVLPVVLTRQMDTGFRWTPLPNTTVIGSVYQLQRPFADLNPAAGNRYEFVGNRRNRGAELSLNARPFKGFTFLGGLGFLDSKLNGPGVDGLRPPGTVKWTIQINTNYEIPWVPGLSFDTNTTSYHDIAGSRNNRVAIPDRTVVTLGMRYRFSKDGRYLVRAYLANVTNVFGWTALGDGGFVFNRPRRYGISLTKDW
jgi:iron complex outermembrane receptor protein